MRHKANVEHMIKMLLKSKDYGKSYFVSVHTLDKILTISRHDGAGKTHLLALCFHDGLYISRENNIYNEEITLCGKIFDTSTHATSSDPVTCRKCIHIINKCGLVIKEE